METSALLAKLQVLWAKGEPTAQDVAQYREIVATLLMRKKAGDAAVTMAADTLQDRIWTMEARRESNHPTHLEQEAQAAGAREISQAMGKA